jgi:protein TonB
MPVIWLAGTLHVARVQAAAAQEPAARPDKANPIEVRMAEFQALIGRLQQQLAEVVSAKASELEGLQRQRAAYDRQLRNMESQRSAYEHNRQIAELEASLAEAQRIYTENHPRIRELHEQLIRMRAEAQQELPATTGPRLIERVEPEYTSAARAAGIRGKVELAVTIGTDGIARDIQIVRGLDPGLDQKAIECVAKWRFRPAIRDGEPVTAFATVEVNFNPGE